MKTFSRELPSQSKLALEEQAVFKLSSSHFQLFSPDSEDCRTSIKEGFFYHEKGKLYSKKTLALATCIESLSQVLKELN